ncbi:MAG: ATP:cob(I)alamin adenosyltransferase [Bacteroidetes bacterium MED-G17]|nr:MAG: ATP:cob(I)alamin adenosyltransferase [Bacteroidetes bacterium TMED39]PDH53489.1 MAG: ATP:cob(I)alamin adenosyltransferase [Bacteroidetes bacterium MED-G17]
MKIYTKTGDKGQTSLLGGTRVSKNSNQIVAYGTIDELNSFIGLLREETQEPESKHLLKIQNELFIIGSNLANDQKKSGIKLSHISKEDITSLEIKIDQMDSELKALKNFILPGGNKPSALAHVCRTITRRAERLVVDILLENEDNQIIIAYLNRLSDFFFTLARFLVQKAGDEEVVWNS